MEQNILNYLNATNLEAEISDQSYIDLMVWHRGLAVPAARNIDDEEVLRGKELFEQIGCAYCHNRKRRDTRSGRLLYRINSQRTAALSESENMALLRHDPAQTAYAE